jgi:formylmethanofuran dehydrogenase subunit E
MTGIHERSVDDLLAEATTFHGHLCPGQVLGVRMVQAGCRETGIAHPRSAGKSLVVIVEIDRCATDAVEALTGVSLGKRTLKHVDFGKMAATFINRRSRASVRIAARESARDAARRLFPHEPDPRQAQIAAYRDMDEADLLTIEHVLVAPVWFESQRVRVVCDGCGEGVHYQREVRVDGRVLCRACGGGRYYHARPAGGGA